MTYCEIDYDIDALPYAIGQILPVWILEENGKEIDRLVGEQKQIDLCNWIGMHQGKMTTIE